MWLVLKSFLELTIWLFTTVNNWSNGNKQADAWNKGAKCLPTLVVSTIWIFRVGFDCHDQKSPECPWNNELDREAEPGLEHFLRAVSPFAF